MKKEKNNTKLKCNVKLCKTNFDLKKEKNCILISMCSDDDGNTIENTIPMWFFHRVINELVDNVLKLLINVLN